MEPERGGDFLPVEAVALAGDSFGALNRGRAVARSTPNWPPSSWPVTTLMRNSHLVPANSRQSAKSYIAAGA